MNGRGVCRWAHCQVAWISYGRSQICRSCPLGPSSKKLARAVCFRSQRVTGLSRKRQALTAGPWKTTSCHIDALPLRRPRQVATRVLPSWNSHQAHGRRFRVIAKNSHSQSEDSLMYLHCQIAVRLNIYSVGYRPTSQSSFSSIRIPRQDPSHQTTPLQEWQASSRYRGRTCHCGT